VDAQEGEFLCPICQDEILCISLPPDAGYLGRGCQATQDAQDTRDAENLTQNEQDAGDPDSMSRASGRNVAVSHAG